jgi:hypothetical protein
MERAVSVRENLSVLTSRAGFMAKTPFSVSQENIIDGFGTDISDGNSNDSFCEGPTHALTLEPEPIEVEQWTWFLLRKKL